ncbi:hypothetical protein INR49_022641 [Caranx melampygus]|nr:hypothetical protein INR49_022641 [Caranx melampygus]
MMVDHSQPLKSLRRLLHTLTFILQSRTASSSSSSRPALPSPPPQSPAALLQTRLPRGSRPRREQGALRGERCRPAQEPQAQLPPPGQIESSWHVSALQRAEGAQFHSEQLGIKRDRT